MNKSLRERINRVVRHHVKRAYGDDTCIGCIRVLGDVLRLGWGVELKPHVVNLRVIPPQALEIVEHATLSDPQRRDRLALPPPGYRAVEMGSNEATNFHLIGVSENSGEGFLWDPSVDQVNKHFAQCSLGPICVPLANVKYTEDKEWGVLELDGFLVMYRDAKVLAADVFGCPAWVMDYDELTRMALDEVKEGEAS